MSTINSCHLMALHQPCKDSCVTEARHVVDLITATLYASSFCKSIHAPDSHLLSIFFVNLACFLQWHGRTSCVLPKCLVQWLHIALWYDMIVGTNHLKLLIWYVKFHLFKGETSCCMFCVLRFCVVNVYAILIVSFFICIRRWIVHHSSLAVR